MTPLSRRPGGRGGESRDRELSRAGAAGKKWRTKKKVLDTNRKRKREREREGGKGGGKGRGGGSPVALVSTNVMNS